MKRYTGFTRALRRAVATFVFAAAGQLVGLGVLDMDVAAWKPIVSAGLGALINLAYRWAEPIAKSATAVDVTTPKPGKD